MTGRADSSQTLIETAWPEQPAVTWLRYGALACAGVMLLTLSAKLKVPFYPVPMTMQTLVVLVVGVAYGWRLGLATVLLYLFVGAVGLPVFADTPARGTGLPYMLGPTGGYLIGFAAATALAGVLAARAWDRHIGWLFAVMLLGHALILALGVAWLTRHIGFARAWAVGLAPFYLATLLKSALGAAVVHGAWLLLARARGSGRG